MRWSQARASGRIRKRTDPQPSVDRPGQRARLAMNPAPSARLTHSKPRRKDQEMRVLVSEFMSLDGVVQAPGGKDEDTSGGFRHGGWSFEFFDPDVMGAVVDEYAGRSEVLLQGRRTYQVSAAAWPQRGGDPFSDWINRAQKYVVSDTLSESDLTWTPTTIIRPKELIS